MTTPTRASTSDLPAAGGAEMGIRPVRAEDRPRLVEIWLRSVRATHTFLTPDDIDGLVEPATAYLTSDETDLWVLADAVDAPIGFMGLTGSEVDSLFLAPEVLRRGGGRRLIQLAADVRGELTVVVNEQNTGAVRFYEACGFATERRSDTDGDGRPFPILFMRRPADPDPSASAAGTGNV